MVRGCWPATPAECGGIRGAQGSTTWSRERMLACDTCGAWRHTRCSGIHDLEPVPERFVCQRCSFHGKSSSPRSVKTTASCE
ncbi:hypothetical protein MLD38_016269 [Melastoma candidum]|uniref:Uncharacterized protein n=1 Tax=Melastoma candidum TaxID=119954 RepID=A0ACB9RK58_9MYRT|nr:hypothetical protein MLD38_016269 [Melastoma candidum]